MQNVLDSMVTALLADSNRKFIYVEQVRCFFFVLALQISINMIIFGVMNFRAFPFEFSVKILKRVC